MSIYRYLTIKNLFHRTKSLLGERWNQRLILSVLSFCSILSFFSILSSRTLTAQETAALRSFDTQKQSYRQEVIRITELDTNNRNFVTFQAEVEKGYQWTARPSGEFPIQLYSYNLNPGDTLFKISAKLGLSYDTIASVNQLSSVGDIGIIKTLYFPNISGVFLRSTDPSLDLELPLTVPTSSGFLLDGYFYPGISFSMKERTNFLADRFVYPVEGGKELITSGYGNRLHPFKKVWQLHDGLDFGVPEGTPVLAAKQGEVIKVSYDQYLGNMIILKHANGYVTTYAHLQDGSILPLFGSFVKKGQVIARSGNTGLSTGPHLHFTIYREGEPQNPRNVLAK